MASILFKYIAKNNILYVFLCLGLGIGIYILADLFDNLDDFVEAGVGLQTTVIYFIVKIPLIISQILPAVFFLALVVQLSLMQSSREITALQSGGISLRALLRIVVIYALAWCMVQLLFSQYLGVKGDEKAREIWEVQVRNRQIDKKTLKNVWFLENNNAVRIGTLQPAHKRGSDVVIYTLNKEKHSIARVLKAQSFEVDGDEWVFSSVQTYVPETFIKHEYTSFRMEIQQDLGAFLAVDPKADPNTLSVGELSNLIDKLKKAGSNVENLRTVLQMKLAYAFSLLVMGMAAVALISYRRNVYINTTLCLLMGFVYYGVFVTAVSAGQKGLLHPVIAAWSGNVTFAGVALFRVLRAARIR